MKMHDITMTIEESMQVYKNKPEKRPSLEITRDFNGSSARESRLSMDMHTGTHLDMPLHFVPGGATVEQLEPDRLVRPCRVLDLSHVEEAVHVEDIETYAIQPGETILLKTRNSATEQFDPSFVYLAGDAAVYLRDLRIDCIGIDGLGIERAQPEYQTHRTLLGAGILIIEGLRLQTVAEGAYLLVAAPLKIAGAEAAPLRALLIEGFLPAGSL